MEELWKDLKDYPGYQVSNCGRIRTYNKITYTKKHGYRHWKNRILKPKISKKDKCARVELWINDSHKTLLLHRLIADTFLENKIDSNLTVNHKDGNRLNNNVNNLEWVTRQENIRYGFENNQYSTCKKCILISDKKEYKFISLCRASIFLNRSKNYISQRLRRKKRTAFDIVGEEYFIKPF